MPEPWQSAALLDVVNHDRVAIRSGHGVGKSAFEAWLILWWLCTRFPAKVACTAPTGHQLNDVLWGEVAKWHRRLKAPFKDWIDTKSERVELKSAPKESFAVARTARKENPEAFQGFHSENMLFLCDEASGIEDVIFEVGEGSMSTVGAKTVLAGNPTRTSGYFYDAFHKNRALWKTRRVACSDSSLVAPTYAENLAAAYGSESNVYRVRVLGEFPLAEDDVVIPLHLCESAQERDVAQVGASEIWGVDVARFGDDRTTLAKRKGNVLKDPVKSWHGKDTMQVAGLVRHEYESAIEKPRAICVDVIGIGAGVVDRLKEDGLPVRAVNVSEQPAAKERFMRQRDELWFDARAWFEARDCKLAKDEALTAELSSVKYAITPSGKIEVESKKKMKERGLRSPDLADAFVLTFAAGSDAGRGWMSGPAPVPQLAIA